RMMALGRAPAKLAPGAPMRHPLSTSVVDALPPPGMVRRRSSVSTSFVLVRAAARRCLRALHVDSSSAPARLAAAAAGTGARLRGVFGSAQGAVAVGDVDGFVVGDVVAQAVPEDLEPAVAQCPQRGVVAFA